MARRKGHHNKSGERKTAKQHVEKRKKKASSHPAGSFEGLSRAQLAKLRR